MFPAKTVCLVMYAEHFDIRILRHAGNVADISHNDSCRYRSPPPAAPGTGWFCGYGIAMFYSLLIMLDVGVLAAEG